MKKFLTMFLILTTAVLVLVSCPEEDPEDPNVPEKYKDFYNYPVGRVSPTGLLKISNNSSSKALLFMDSVSPSNYIGTVEGMNQSIEVKLPEQKFYTIVAVDKDTYEERGDQAAQYSDLTYYSNTLHYSMTVTASSTYGSGTWYIYNQTNYWVSFKASDRSGAIYAVAPPNALRFSVPVQIGQNIQYVPHFYRELKYNGRVIALVETDMMSEADIVVTTTQNPTFTTNIGGQGFQPPSQSVKPAIYFTNSSDRSGRIYIGQQNQLSAIGMLPGEDFALASGTSQMFTDLEAGISTSNVNFELPSGSRVYVPQSPDERSITMSNNKVYRIVLSGNATQGYSYAVEEESAEGYFN